MKQLQNKKNSLADESEGSYGTDSWLLDFSRMKPLAEIDTFPGTLEEVVNEWIENCQSIGGIKLVECEPVDVGVAQTVLIPANPFRPPVSA